MTSPRPGCSRAAHEALGWCGHCPDLTLAVEAAAWRLVWLNGTAMTAETARQIVTPPDGRTLDG